MKNYFYSYNEHDNLGKIISNGWGFLSCNPQFLNQEIMNKIQRERVSQLSYIHVIALNQI